MQRPLTRRCFLQSAATAGALIGASDLGFLLRLPSVSAEEAELNPKLVRFSSEIEPVVRLIEDTPRNRLLEEVAARIHRGVTYREVLAALLLAGVRNVQPRPVGFKFHAVLVVNSAHLASLASPDSDRWLPIFWALDQFKDSQARNKTEGDWHLAPVDETAVPTPDKARHAFTEAMDNWDEAAADAAVAGLARTATPQEIFEIFCRFGVRDFRDIGHKAIYVANSWRTLRAIGWQHAEPVLRSLAYALLQHEGDNPAKRDAPADRPWRRNLELIQKFPKTWETGQPDESATTELLTTLREGSSEEACDKVVELVGRGVAPQSVWDAVFQGAGELVMRRPGIISLHAATSANALHFAYGTTASEETRRMLLLQNAAFIPLFRGGKLKGAEIDRLETEPTKTNQPVEEIFADLGSDRMAAARKALGYLKGTDSAEEFIHAARRFIFLKGTNAHDYKFSSAVLEDYFQISPKWRARYLAASVFQLRGSGAADNSLVQRTRAALG